MNSVRERVLRENVTRLASAIAPTPVLRMPAVPVTREASPALLLFVDGDSITAHANHLVDRLLVVRLAVVARGADAFDVADQALVAAHAAMLADPNLGGLAIAVREIDCEWEFDDADAGAVALPARYEIRYRKVSKDRKLIFVEYTYSASYRIPGLKTEEWRHPVTDNRLELVPYQDEYRIVAGM